MGAVLGHVATTISMARRDRPLHQSNGRFIEPIGQMLAEFKNFDPPVSKKLAGHPNLPKWVCKHGHRKGTGTE